MGKNIFVKATLAFWAVFFAALFARIIFQRPDGLYVGYEHVWTDWPMHIGLALSFATKNASQWFAYHPLFADGPLNYTFLMDLISGMLIRAGLSVPLAFILPSVLCAAALLAALYSLLNLVLESKKQAAAAISIFFLSSGLGFVGFIAELFASPSFDFLLYPPRPYSRIDAYNWYSGNVIAGLLTPQRSFLLGFTLGAVSLALLAKELFKARPSASNLIFAGCLAGLLPLAHIHSLLATATLAAALAIPRLKRWKDLALYAIPATALSLLLYKFFLASGLEGRKLVHWQPGWSANGLWDWIGMWLKIWGLAIPLALFGFSRVKARKTRWFFAGFFALFAVANLVLFQPVAWDNSKIFFWSYLGFAALAAKSLGWLWAKRAKTPAVALAVCLCATGALELLHLQRIDRHELQILSQEDQSLMEQVRTSTAPLDRFLTATSHIHPVMTWAARPIFMGFLGWLGNFGFEVGARYDDVKAIYSGAPNAPELLRRHQIHYVVLGPYEEAEFHPNEAFFRASYRLAFQSANTRIYDASQSMQQRPRY